MQYTLPDGSGPQTSVIAGKSPDNGYWLQNGAYVGSAYITGVTPPSSAASNAPMPSLPASGATGGSSAGNATVPAVVGSVGAAVGGVTIGDVLATAGSAALGLAVRGAALLGEGLLATVVAPAVFLAGVFWPSSTSANDTTQGRGATATPDIVQSNPPDSNTPPPPPPAISPAGQTGSPVGPEDPEGNLSATDQTNTELNSVINSDIQNAANSTNPGTRLAGETAQNLRNAGIDVLSFEKDIV